MRNGNETLNGNKVKSGCLGIIVTCVLIGIYFFVPVSSFLSPAPAFIQGVAPIIGLIAVVFIIYSLVRMWLAAMKKGNNTFMEDVSKYLWGFNLALVVLLLVHYFGK